MFRPKLEQLPQPQQSLWPELAGTPKNFVLYGGTAMVLRLGHRVSEDFDFFTNDGFEPNTLVRGLSYLKGARVDQRANNTLSVVIDRRGPVKVSFYGAIGIHSVHEPDVVANHGLQVASLLDLAGSKLKTIQQRAEAKDYLDLAAAMDAGINLPDALAAARAIYGKVFNVVTALKALTYFEDGNLRELAPAIQSRLRGAAQQVKIEALPSYVVRPGITSGE